MKVSEQLFAFWCSCAFISRYNTFCGYPPEVVKKMPKKDLAEEVYCFTFSFLIKSDIKFLTILTLHVDSWCSTIRNINFIYNIFTFFNFVESQVWRLQAALGEQSEITKYSQQEYERLQNVLLPILNRTIIFTSDLWWQRSVSYYILNPYFLAFSGSFVCFSLDWLSFVI